MIRSSSLVDAIRARAAKASRQTAPIPQLPPIQHHPELGWLHQNWPMPISFDQTGIAAPKRFRDKIRWRIARVAWTFLERYMVHSQEIAEHQMRMTTLLAQRCDSMEERFVAAMNELRGSVEELAAVSPLVATAERSPAELGQASRSTGS